MPLSRLDEPPDTDAILEDLTCDSDGHIETDVHGDGICRTLPLHAIGPGEDYLLGLFLVGAYQEILGDLHNLFGDTHSVKVELAEHGGWRLVDPDRGDRVDELLRYVHFDPDSLLARFREKMDRTDLDKDHRASLLRGLEDGLSAYTYLQS